LLGFYAYRTALGKENERAASRFVEHIADQVRALEKEVAVGIEALHALHSLYDCSQEVTREEFAAFARMTLSRRPSIQALEWIPCVPGHQREVYEERARRDGLAEYFICDHLPTGHMIPSPPRDVHFPVYFVEPLAGNERALGFDLGSDALRRAALSQAAESRKATLSDPVVLVQETGSSYGILGFHAVYSHEIGLDPSAADSLAGFVLSVFRVDDILEQSLLEAGDLIPSRMQFELVDADVNGEPLIIYSTPGFDPAEMPRNGGWQKEVPLEDQQWLLNAYPTEAFLALHSTHHPLVLGIGNFVVWELLVIILIALAKWSIDQTLRRKDRMMRLVCGSLTEGVVVADNDGKFVLFNKAAQSILGQGAADVTPDDWSTSYGCYLPDTETPYPADQLPLARALRGEVVMGEDVFIRRPTNHDGTWISINGAPILDEEGQASGGVVTFRDVTETRRSEELARLLFNALGETDDMVFITDHQGKIEYVNPAFETITGFSKDEALGQSPRILKSGIHEEKHYEELWSTILAGNVFRKMVTNRKKNGELFIADQTITPIKDRTGRVTRFVSVVKDLTEFEKRQRQEVEMHLASLVQRKLFPQEAPSVAGFDIAGAVFPAEATCGDYFDFIPMPGDSLGIAVGDVSGHGFGPALLMAATRAFLRSLMQSHSDLGTILAKTNSSLSDDFEDHRYVTLLLARLDVYNRHLEYANAGHIPAYVLGGDGTVKATLNSTGLPLGMINDAEYETGERIPLEPDDTVIFLTDGVTESQAHNDRFLPSEDILELVRTHRQETARQIVDRIHGATRDFGEGLPQNDDITIVVCKVGAETAAAAEK
jgi:PAS domain S-box-containing protein